VLSFVAFNFEPAVLSSFHCADVLKKPVCVSPKIRRCLKWRGRGSLKDIDLVAQGYNLNLELMPRSQIENDGGEQEAEHESRGYRLNRATAIFSTWMEFLACTP
jgi:hypothetical protein